MERLIENTLITAQSYKKIEKPLEESLMVEGTPYKSLAVYRFEFTRPGKKNLNGRIYSHRLWDKVLRESPVTLALMDHPEEGAGNPKDVWAVVRNPQYSEDRSVVTADAYIIDNENGRSALGVLEAGGDLGLSSSGYGDFLEDGVTVDPDSFQLERYFDWVLQPSYEVYGHKEDKVGESVSNFKKENSMKEMTLREKRDYEISMKKILEEVSAINDSKEKLRRAKEALTFYEGVDCVTYKEDFENLVKASEEEWEEALDKVKELENISKRAEQSEFDVGTLSAEIKEKNKAIDDLNKKLSEKEKELSKKENFILEYKELLESFTKDLSDKIPIEDYERLRAFAEKAVSLLNEKRTTIAKLQVENMDLKEKLNVSEKRLSALADKQMLEELNAKNYQYRIQEARRRNEQKILESKERELISQANPEVMAYYEDLLKRGEDVFDLKEEILKKKSLMEAQLLFLKRKNHPVYEEQKLVKDLSQPLTEGRGTKVKSSLNLPKGFL